MTLNGPELTPELQESTGFNKFLFTGWYSQSWWSLYALAYSVIVFIERYYYSTTRHGGCGITFPDPFFLNNSWRLLLLLIPIAFLTIFDIRRDKGRVVLDLPFLVLPLFMLATHQAQPVLFLIFILGSCFLKPRVYALMGFVILLFVCFQAFSPFIGPSGCAPISSVKANMHTFETLVEIYAVDHRKKTPVNVNLLKKAASHPNKNAYWKEFTNPMTNQSGFGKSYSDISKSELRLLAISPEQDIDSPPYPKYLPRTWRCGVFGISLCQAELKHKYTGQVLYYRINDSHYLLYGVDKKGTLIKDKGELFTLSNS